jgi:hypothetical protein
VFYVADGTFASPGSTCNTAGVGGISTCKYLEAAPSDHSSTVPWATLASAYSCYDPYTETSENFCSAASIYPGGLAAQDASRTAATAIGMGMANTNQAYARITTFGGDLTSSYAAGVAWAYTNNRQTDWFLPSKDELSELFRYRTQVGGFTEFGNYWSSSEKTYPTALFRYNLTSDRPPDDWWFWNWSSKHLTVNSDLGDPFAFYVRPVRAF